MEFPLERAVNPDRHPAWPERLLSLLQSSGAPRPEEARSEFWLLLNLALLEKLRFHSRGSGPLVHAELHDLAAEKTLELVGKLDCGQWKPLERSAGELVNFISAVARNALVDELRRLGRGGVVVVDETMDRRGDVYRIREEAGLQAERREFIASLVACAERLKPEHRTVWLLRVLHEMPSRNIAGHPEVRFKAGHVDVILGRCREQIRGCMKARGLESGTLPSGTFAELWNIFRSTPHSSEAGHDG